MFLAYGGVCNFVFTPAHVCILKMLRITGNSNTYAKHETFLTPDLPHPASQTWLPGPGP